MSPPSLLSNPVFCPTWAQLPYDFIFGVQDGQICPVRRELENHWCVLGEIEDRSTETVKQTKPLTIEDAIDAATFKGPPAPGTKKRKFTTLAEHHLLLRDKAGTSEWVRVWISPDGPTWRSFKVGHTLAIMYPERIQGQQGGGKGARSETDGGLYASNKMVLFPFALSTLLRAGSHAEADRNACRVCGQTHKQRSACGHCRMVTYCRNGDCRRTDRDESISESHKGVPDEQRHGQHAKYCHALKKLRPFLEKDWEKFEGYWES